MRGEYNVNADTLFQYHNMAKAAARYFQRIEYAHIPRSQNSQADAQARANAY